MPRLLQAILPEAIGGTAMLNRNVWAAGSLLDQMAESLEAASLSGSLPASH